MNRLIFSILCLVTAAPAFAGMFIPNRVPTLDDFGLVALTSVVAIAGGIAARRKKKK
jgi:hypothetical protein